LKFTFSTPPPDCFGHAWRLPRNDTKYCLSSRGAKRRGDLVGMGWFGYIFLVPRCQIATSTAVLPYHDTGKDLVGRFAVMSRNYYQK